ncbi:MULTISPECIES: threonine--tRNA ligase [Mesotoga]|jgi:threonyl-tRNA synthetase|uniref:threonine--tRNA ligase n=1 Tax=Mesotoga TaxID=1184396 RepID=UPI0002CB7B00|nr:MULTISPECIES: threonine--tRNA ligase [Mesotoga]MCP5456986.1 threonine--tRNA ligase [Thermotogota bacterium]CCU84017.1 Threonine--tRNA ligase [Mesotoga infera]MCP5460203.1 threonine--tRNA ligase [Thermotogota bacterium]RLL81871.1 threonyl-tRNA synthetase [Mesotoga sp. H07pep.5.4]HNQ69803.1 threonine--tRNA ligase [Mesotoga prima]
MAISIKLPDGSIKEYESGITPAEIAKDISEGLARRAFGAIVDEELWDLERPIEKDASVKLVLDKDPESSRFFRHTMSHILAQAIMRLYGKEKVKLAIGPTIENGFYYDIDLGETRITEEDLPKIESEMNKIIKEDLPVERFELPVSEAIELMKREDQPYKVQLIEDLVKDTGAEKVTFYKQGEFVDLCRGPHVSSTGKVKYFKLTSVSGAYWRGDENNKMLQRVYGTAFAKKSDLEDYLRMIEEAKKRDHRKLGPALGLFTINYEYAPGMPVFLPKGTEMLNQLLQFSREKHVEDGYREVSTPQIMSDALWRTSGHWDHYRDNMYFTEKEDQQFAVKPMNCPGHIIIYKSSSVSYRDLPMKLFEFGKVHRYERSGVLHGLFRVRGFVQDDAHIFCTREQIQQEIMGVIDFVQKIYSPFNFEYRAELSTRPEDYMGEVELWDIATKALEDSLVAKKMEFKVNEGDGAFYGPKIDYHIKDSLGREWQCATIQLDFMMPERFGIKYVGPDNEEYQPVMIHRAIFGSVERFMGILIEHFAGAFPAWLAPTQVSVIPIADRHAEYAESVAAELKSRGFRVEVDDRQKSTNYKIREAQLMKVPYMIIVGDREKEDGTISVRLRSEKDLGSIALQEFMDKLSQEVNMRSATSIFE